MLEIRPYQRSDRDGLVALVVPIQREEFGVPITPEEQPDLLAPEPFFSGGASRFWVADAGGEIVGSLGLLDIGEGQAVLRKMFVRTDFRGPPHKTAQRLLDACLAWSRERGLRELLLGTTAKYLAAHRFYEKNGFTQLEADALPARFPRVAVDTRFYKRVLTP